MQNESNAPGQQKTHTATRPNPTDPAGAPETREFTQEEWRNRDKSEGWTRPEDSGTDSAEPTE